MFDPVPPALITGATGFVGSHVAEAYARAGHRLRCTVRATSDVRRPRELGAELAEADLRRDDLGAAVDGVEIVVHLAGLTRARSAAEYREANVQATLRLTRAASRAGVRRFVFVSSLAARGPEGAEGPVSDYGRSKREAEEGLGSGGEGGESMRIVVLRPGGIYGPRDRAFLPLFRLAARGVLPIPRGGPPVQPVYVEDVAEATLRAGTAKTGPGPYPVAGAEPLAWERIRRGMETSLGRKVRTLPLPTGVFRATGTLAEWAARTSGRTPGFDRRRADDIARHAWTCDLTATERGLGWRPRTSATEGFRRTVAWYRAVGWL